MGYYYVLNRMPFIYSLIIPYKSTMHLGHRHTNSALPLGQAAQHIMPPPPFCVLPPPAGFKPFLSLPTRSLSTLPFWAGSLLPPPPPPPQGTQPCEQPEEVTIATTCREEGVGGREGREEERAVRERERARQRLGYFVHHDMAAKTGSRWASWGNE